MSTSNFELDEFTILLREFNALVKEKPPVEKIKKELLKIKAKAEKSAELNYRQKDAVIARCDNYINSEYGNTKRAEHYEQGKPSSK